MDEYPPVRCQLPLSDSHRRYIRALIGEMRELIDVHHRQGMSVEVSSELVSRFEHLEQARTFRMVPGGEPEPTSYGIDSYRRIFGQLPGHARAAAEQSPS